jgi:hypothetical protein
VAGYPAFPLNVANRPRYVSIQKITVHDFTAHINILDSIAPIIHCNRLFTRVLNMDRLSFPVNVPSVAMRNTGVSLSDFVIIYNSTSSYLYISKRFHATEWLIISLCSYFLCTFVKSVFKIFSRIVTVATCGEGLYFRTTCQKQQLVFQLFVFASISDSFSYLNELRVSCIM